MTTGWLHLHWVVVAVAAGNIIFFSLGVLRLFKTVHEPRLPLKALLACAAPGYAIGLLYVGAGSDLTNLRAALSITMLSVAQVVFAGVWRANAASRLSHAFSDDAPVHLQRNGPYGWIRHPAYAAYLLTYWALFVASARAEAFLVALVMSAIYLAAARKEERKFAGSNLAEEYAEYRRQVGMLFPKPCFRRRS